DSVLIRPPTPKPSRLDGPAGWGLLFPVTLRPAKSLEIPGNEPFSCTGRFLQRVPSQDSRTPRLHKGPRPQQPDGGVRVAQWQLSTMPVRRGWFLGSQVVSYRDATQRGT